MQRLRAHGRTGFGARCGRARQSSRRTPRDRHQQGDKIAKPDLLPVIERWGMHSPGVDVVPISARPARTSSARAGRGPAAADRCGAVPRTRWSDRTPQFIAQEIIREQLYSPARQGAAYACAVQVETWTEKTKQELSIARVIVERDSQKAIVVGKGGSRIRELGIAAPRPSTRARKTVHVAVRQSSRVEPRRARADPVSATAAKAKARSRCPRSTKIPCSRLSAPECRQVDAVNRLVGGACARPRTRRA